MEEKILIDKETLKAIAVDTRLNILKLLFKKKYTLSDIAEILGFGNSTVKEHLDILSKADLIKKEDTERKWKYYSLTFKGRRLIEPREIKVLFAFITTLIAAVGMAFVFAKNFLIKGAQTFAAEAPKALNVMEAAKGTVVEESADIVQLAEETIITGTQISSYNLSIIMFVVLLVLIALSAFFFGMLLKKPQLIITKGGNKK
ncbi:winged helix-turn-helix transcriptional regulator [Candidatus Woesearchaeota archaeon]|nr:winged helix-turn-helix transcriptional regulator [Candidatus Woesearchaeota archaeon]